MNKTTYLYNFDFKRTGWWNP